MLSNANQVLLEETIRNSKEVIDTIYSVLPNVGDDDLNYDLNRQIRKYESTLNRAKQELQGNQFDYDYVQDIENRELISLEAHNNPDSDIIAKLIQKNEHASSQLKELVNEYKSASTNSISLVNELLEEEKQVIDIMRSYQE